MAGRNLAHSRLLHAGLLYGIVAVTCLLRTERLELNSDHLRPWGFRRVENLAENVDNSGQNTARESIALFSWLTDTKT